MPQGLIRIVLPLLMVMAFLLYVLSAQLDGSRQDNNEPASTSATE